MESSTASLEAKSDETIIPFPPSSAKKVKNKNQTRFSDDQIRLLESIFESESRLEPTRKLQIAGELGLHPRQVAIWFQNRRARWKSKQIEHRYRTLRADYDDLASRFESLKQEKESLLLQLQKLNVVLDQKPQEDGNPTRDKATIKSEPDTNPSNFFKETFNDDRLQIVEEESLDGSEKSSKIWYGIEFTGLIDPLCSSSSSSSSHWLNSWI